MKRTELKLAGAAETAPADPEITPYDEGNYGLYCRLLDFDAAGVDWRLACRELLSPDPQLGIEGARQCWESHLARAHWMTAQGYKQLRWRPVVKA